MEKALAKGIEDPGRVEQEKDEYTQVIELRAALYDRIIEERPEAQGIRDNVEVHEKIVRQYSQELIEVYPGLSPEQKATAEFAVILHDCGKLENIDNHHEPGAINAGEILSQLGGQEIDGLEITQEIIDKVKEAIDRHMNHPYLVQRRGECFPWPEDDVDKIVFDADMMANVGFKNVGFRLVSSENMEEDALVAEKQKPPVPVLEESFRNVMEGEEVGQAMPGIKTGFKSLGEVVMSDSGKTMIKGLIKDAEAIFEYLKDNGIFEKVEAEFSGSDGKFGPNIDIEKSRLIRDRLSQEILEAGKELDIDESVADNFKM